MTVLSTTRCVLGEGVFWHPTRASLFWFDILGATLFEMQGGVQRHWVFDRPVSAAGWVDGTRLLISSATDLFVFDVEAGTQTHVLPLEADQPLTRSNDGRADPQGGMWVSTMGYDGEAGMGAIYRYYRGTLLKLFDAISIPNAICFAPDGRSAYFTDTVTQVIQRVALDAQGWPVGAPQPWLDLRAEGLNPDGAVIDAAGQMWNAQWGASRVACYAPDGRFVSSHALPATQTSCPAFGGPDLQTLFVTSAARDMPDDDRFAGQTFALAVEATGQAEHQVIL